MQRLGTIAICLFAAASGTRAQTPAPAFEVASVKPAAPGARGSFINPSPGGRLNVTNMTLKDMIVIAWRVQPFQVSGGPSWYDSDHYDIIAKAESNPGPDQMPPMLQSLLVERFALKFHRESKEMPVYELVALKSTGKTFPGLTEAKEGGCVMSNPTAGPPQLTPGSKMPCGMMRMGINQINATAQTLSQLTRLLSRLLGRTVIDKTGLTAKYDMTLEWAPDQSQIVQLPPDAPRPPAGDASGPSIFTAIEEQMGLRLESKKGPVETFVIDHAEKPSEN